jgi:two-component sensor histidine kinase
VNLEFERTTSLKADQVHGKSWTFLRDDAKAVSDGRQLSEAIANGEEYIGTFRLSDADDAKTVDVWSNTILDDNGVPTFRLVAFAELMKNSEAEDNEARSELQHRVKNNLQMITALIRLEAHNVQDGTTSAHFERLAGRVSALASCIAH